MRRFVFLLCLSLAAAPASGQKAKPTEFSRLIERLSESGGFFHSDNLVSNESSYLHVLGVFRSLNVRGGAYVGVGPEQSFSYLAALEPAISILVDIRRDNMLLHLMLKAIFESSRNRLEYLCLLYGRPRPPDLAMWTDLPLASLLDYISRRPADSALHAKNHRALMRRVTKYGVPLTDLDRATLRRFHDEFATAGLDIQYTTRAGQSWRPMPTNRDLYLQTDQDGTPASYLSTEGRWRTVRGLERANKVVPVVGDLSGTKAMAAIAKYLAEIEQPVSVFYVSNVEQYLFRQGSFAAFAANVRALPSRPNSLLVRSVVGGRSWSPASPAQTISSHQRAQPFKRFLELTAIPDSIDYWTLITDTVELQ